MENIKSITEFPITVYGKIEQYTDTISSARCRIFYKGLNRNGTYISNAFAEELVKTLPYTPIKGIYDEFMEDFEGHGKERTEGRIYGIVPESNNFAWEKFMDEDGVEREYACCDVYLFTGLYAEAKTIVGKSQSMELYLPSIKGNWEFVDGERCYVYTAGSFLGLQVLGDDVEPCFEGAAFFELVGKLESALKQIEKINFANQQGGNEMPEIAFKLSDERFAKLWGLLNPISEATCGEDNEDKNRFECGYQICGIYDNYALAYNLETSSFERVYFEENEEGMVIKEKQVCNVLEVSEHELETLNNLRSINGSFEKIAENFEEINRNFEEQKESFSTLNVENEELKNNYEQLNQNYEQLKNEFELLKSENEGLAAYKLEKETQEKNEIIDKYVNELDESVIESYRAKTAEFSLIDLEKELAYELVQSKPTIFSQSQVKIPSDIVDEGNSLTSILEKYRKNGGK